MGSEYAAPDGIGFCFGLCYKDDAPMALCWPVGQWSDVLSIAVMG
jgi:hypothetical protein